MLSPETPGPDQDLPEGLVIPDTVEALITLERSENNQAVMEIGRHCLRLGVAREDKAEQVHLTYIDDRTKRLALVANRLHGARGALHVIVNDTLTCPDETRNLRIREFVVAFDVVRVAVSRSELVRRHHDKRWEIQEDTGPVLFKRHDRLDISRGNNNTIPRPAKYTPENLLEVDLIDQRILKRELADVLSTFNEVSLEPDIKVSPY